MQSRQAEIIIPTVIVCGNRINTAAEYMSNLGHGLGAFVGSNIWRVCVERQIYQGRAVWLILFGISCLVTYLAWRVTDEPGWRENEEEL